MDTTPNLTLPFIAAAQAQKHVTHNEALRALDAVVQLTVLDKDLNAPPDTPVDGARYIVAPSPGGAWTGQAGSIAAFQDGAWAFYAPREGWLAWTADEDALYVWTGAAWLPFTSGSGIPGGGTTGQMLAKQSTADGDAGWTSNLPGLGLNADPDPTNRLAVKSDAVLFSHDDVTPGSGDVQFKINKAGPARTASLLFQSNWSGRAEVGLTSDDDFHFKVSPDGSTWHEALTIDRTSGNVLVGGSASPASAQRAIVLFNGAAPTASVGDGVVLFAQDVSASSELRVRDEAGNVTTLSPHNFAGIPEGPSEPMAWAYHSERGGRAISVDLLRVIRLVEQLTGETLVHESEP